MKKVIISALVLVTVLQACQKNDVIKKVQTEKVQQVLLEKYPNASDIVWRTKNGYKIADFTEAETKANRTYTHSAWFDNNNDWLMTEIDIRFNQLPEAVISAFKQTEYASWRVDDVDKIERAKTQVIYVIEVEQGAVEVDLYFSPDGVLVKEVKDVDEDYDYEDYIPAEIGTSIEEFISTKYPNSRILEIDREKNGIEVEILDGRIKRELLFDLNNKWIYTKTEIKLSQVPENIIAALNNSEYATYRKDDIDHYVTSNNEYYVIELEKGEREVKLCYSINGELLDEVQEIGYKSNNNGGNIPKDNENNSSIEKFISEKYPNAKIIEIDREKNGIEVEILDGKIKRELLFDLNNKWIYTKTEVKLSQVPENIIAVLNNSEYAKFRIDNEVDHYLTADKEYYVFELESGNREVEIEIDLQGNLTVIKNK